MSSSKPRSKYAFESSKNQLDSSSSSNNTNNNSNEEKDDHSNKPKKRFSAFHPHLSSHLSSTNMFPPPIQEKKEKEGNAEKETETEAEATTLVPPGNDRRYPTTHCSSTRRRSSAINTTPYPTRLSNKEESPRGSRSSSISPLSELSRSATFHDITQSMIGEMESDDDSDAGGEETGSTWYQMCDQSLRSFHLIARRVRLVSCFLIVVLHPTIIYLLYCQSYIYILTHSWNSSSTFFFLQTVDTS